MLSCTFLPGEKKPFDMQFKWRYVTVIYYVSHQARPLLGLTHPAVCVCYLFLREWLFTREAWLTPPLTVCVSHNASPVCGFVSLCTHLGGELCSVEAHSSPRSGYPLDYWEWSVPPSPAAHRFSSRWQRTEMGQRHSHANHLRHLQHLVDQWGNKIVI